MILQFYWSILLIFFTVFVIYCNIPYPLVFKTQHYSAKDTNIPVKKIVAYSLRKQFELEAEEYFCDQRPFKNRTLDKLSSKGGEYWKKVANAEVYLLSVALDRRLEPYHYLRIVAVIKGSWDDTLYCQILMNDGHVQVIKSTVTPIWYKKWDSNDNNTYFNPTLISCRLPILQELTIPNAFSISKSPCEASKKFSEIPESVARKPRHFTVCVKPLNFKKDISVHLVQWIEICRIFGAEYFYLFVGNITRNTRKILEWYKTEFPNMIHLEEFRPVDNPNNLLRTTLLQRTWQRRRYEIITYNSCFYKNMNSKYVIPLDIDELIVPKSGRSWQNIVQNLDNYSSLIVQNVYFFTQGNKEQAQLNNPFFLRVNKRSESLSKKGENGKSFISTKSALTVFNHYSLHLLRPGVIKDYFLPFSDVQLNHYKEFCNPVIFPDCSKYLSSLRIDDNVLFKYRDKFNERYRDVLDKIKKYGIKLL